MGPRLLSLQEDVISAILPRGRPHFLSAFVLSIVSSQHRLVSLLLLVLVDPLQHSVHLLLQEELELVDHEFVDGALLGEVCHKALHGVTLVHDDSLDTEVCHVDINIELGFSIIARVFLWGRIRLIAGQLHATVLLNRRGRS